MCIILYMCVCGCVWVLYRMYISTISFRTPKITTRNHIKNNKQGRACCWPFSSWSDAGARARRWVGGSLMYRYTYTHIHTCSLPPPRPTHTGRHLYSGCVGRGRAGVGIYSHGTCTFYLHSREVFGPLLYIYIKPTSHVNTPADSASIYPLKHIYTPTMPTGTLLPDPPAPRHGLGRGGADRRHGGLLHHVGGNPGSIPDGGK